ncbi:MAG: hypothetical protein R2795_23370 [Saprospiraceae bacterium]
MPIQSPWSYEELLKLAPDAGTLDRARKLFFSKRWITLAGNGEWLWGAYETAYGDVSKAVVRLTPPLFRCTCKSRRRPCHHSLALVLLFLNRQEAWKVEDSLPEWAFALTHQSEISKPSIPKNDSGQADKRLALMDAGVAELDRWLQHIARLGLAQAVAVPDEWEIIASRMVDAKLGSIARRIRVAKASITGDGWLDPVAEEIGLLYLFVRAWQRKETLTPGQKRELLQVAGWAVRKEQLVGQPGISDNWLVLGVTTGVEEKLTFRRTWLRGETTKKFALLLDFAYGNAGFEAHYTGGSVLNGQLVYYPGQPAFRAIFTTFKPSNDPYQVEAITPDWAQLRQDYAEALGLSPWLLAFPAWVENIKVGYDNDAAVFLLIDRQGYCITSSPTNNAWKLLAISGGYEVAVFGEYDGKQFTPLSVLADGRLVVL